MLVGRFEQAARLARLKKQRAYLRATRLNCGSRLQVNLEGEAIRIFFYSDRVEVHSFGLLPLPVEKAVNLTSGCTCMASDSIDHLWWRDSSMVRVV